MIIERNIKRKQREKPKQLGNKIQRNVEKAKANGD